MKINISKIRSNYGMSKKDFAKLIGISPNAYAILEENEEIPSKYVYILWKALEDFPIPEDFFFFTSFTLQVNMDYHRLTQKDITKLFDIPNQSTVSLYLKENVPMYEKKEYFLKFDPFVLPTIVWHNTNEKSKKLYRFEEITDLIAKGNFIVAEKRKKNKQFDLIRTSSEDLMNEITHNETKKII